MSESIDPMQKIEEEILEAKKILSEKDGFFGLQMENIVTEFIDLEIDDATEIWPIVRELLQEIKLEDCVEAKLHHSIPEYDLFTFAWNSKKLGRFVTFKFALSGGNFFYISLR